MTIDKVTLEPIITTSFLNQKPTQIFYPNINLLNPLNKLNYLIEYQLDTG